MRKDGSLVKSNNRTQLFFVLSLLVFFVSGCDEGIAPRPELIDLGFEGTITFIGEWPEGVQRTHIVMFKEPLNSADDFTILNIRYIGSEIPANSTTYNYNTSDNFLEAGLEAGDYAYLAVAQSFSPDLSLVRSDWVVVGIYSKNPDQSPSTLTLPVNASSEDINITCDFTNPPPQPPGKNLAIPIY